MAGSGADRLPVMDEKDVEALIGPEWMRVARARNALADAVASVAQTAPDVEDFTKMGTEQLGPAVAALVASDALHDHEDGARWVSRSFTALPAEMLKTGMSGLAFGGSVLMLRMALMELDEALEAAGDPEDPPAPGGPSSSG